MRTPGGKAGQHPPARPATAGGPAQDHRAAGQALRRGGPGIAVCRDLASRCPGTRHGRCGGAWPAVSGPGMAVRPGLAWRCGRAWHGGAAGPAMALRRAEHCAAAGLHGRDCRAIRARAADPARTSRMTSDPVPMSLMTNANDCSRHRQVGPRSRFTSLRSRPRLVAARLSPFSPRPGHHVPLPGVADSVSHVLPGGEKHLSRRRAPRDSVNRVPRRPGILLTPFTGKSLPASKKLIV